MEDHGAGEARQRIGRALVRFAVVDDDRKPELGCEIEMRAEGPAAGPVLAALVDLIDRKFDEE